MENKKHNTVAPLFFREESILSSAVAALLLLFAMIFPVAIGIAIACVLRCNL